MKAVSEHIPWPNTGLERKGSLQTSKKSSQGNRRETRKVSDVVAKETKHLKEGDCSGVKCAENE